MLQAFIARQWERLAQCQAALLREQQRAITGALRWQTVTRIALETRVGTTPNDVVFRTGSLELLRYRRDSPARERRPVLFCYALVNRPYILDLQPDKSVVRRYLEQGFDVYMIDWGVPTHADRHLALEDYVCTLLRRVMDFIREQHACSDLHLIGYCMGGTLAALHAALDPPSVATLTLLAAPVDFEGQDSILNVWANSKHFDVDNFIDIAGNCPAWFLQLCFLYTKPVQNLIEKGISFREQLEDDKFLTNYFAMERWVNDNIPVAGETFRQFVKKLYQQNQLVRGELELGGLRVDLRRISCPLLLLTAKKDHLVAPASTQGIRPHVSSSQIDEMTIDAGHVGLVVSSKAHKTLWPEAARWLTRWGRDQDETQPTL